MPSKDKSSRSVRAVFFTHFSTDKSDSTVALLGKGAASPPAKFIRESNLLARRGIDKDSLNEVVGFRASTAAFSGNLATLSAIQIAEASVYHRLKLYLDHERLYKMRCAS